MALTAKRVARLRRKPGRYLDEQGLLLQVRSPTNVSWLFRYERDGHEHMMGVGSVKTLSLKEARLRARALRQQLLDGIDPLEAKNAKKAARKLEAAKALTFKQAAHQYFDEHKAIWRNSRGPRAQFLSTLEEYAFPIIGDLPVSAIDTPLVLEVLEQKHHNYPDQKLWHALTTTATLTATERAQRIAELSTHIDELERSEETLIEAAQAQGIEVARRTDCSAPCVLGVRIAQPKAPAQAA
jgi:hypothetical protein